MKGVSAKAYRKRAGEELAQYRPENWGMFRTRDGWVIRKVPREDDKVERHFAISGLPQEEDDITWVDHIIQELHKAGYANLAKVRRV